MRFRAITQHILLLPFLSCFLCCSTESNTANGSYQEGVYTTSNAQILKDGNPITLYGVNALNTFGIDDSNLMQEWNIEIVREFIGNLREQPIVGNAIQDSKKQWLHPLQELVEMHRKNGRVTILCPFGWVDTNGNQQLFTGLNPSEQAFFEEYKKQMQAIANQFKDQSDVWIEVWNEPYTYTNGNGYSHELWLQDQLEMIQNLRDTGFNNIILVPGNGQGQSEAAILALGDQILSKHKNIVFDLHAYENWLINTDEAAIKSRILKLKNANFPIVFGEIGVINSSGLMHVQTFLDVVSQTNTSTLGWIWKRDQSDQNALLNAQNTPNNLNNNSWGSTFLEFLTN